MADGGQDRRGPAGAGDRHPGGAGRALGRAADPAVRQVTCRSCCRARRSRSWPGRRSTCPSSPASRSATQVLRAATDKIMTDVTGAARRAARASRRRPSSTTRRSPAGSCARSCARCQRYGRRREQRRRPSRRQPARRQRLRRTPAGRRRPAAGAPARVRAPCWAPGPGAPRSPRCSATPGLRCMLWCRRPELADVINASTRTRRTTCPASRCPPRCSATADPARGAGRRGPGGAGRPGPDAAAEPGRLARSAAAGGAAGQPDEGHRARHRRPDEPGHRRGDRRRPGPDRGDLRAEPGPGDRRPGSTAPPSWPAPTTAVAEQLQKACHTGYFRPYTNPDVIGCELGGAVKNVIALGRRHRGRHGPRRQHPGDADHPGPGRDRPARRGARRGPAHVRRAGRAWATWSPRCSSPLSRNRTFGEKLGRGMPLADVLAEHRRRRSEGVKSSESVLQLARTHGVEMPITEVMVGVMHDGLEIGAGGAAAGQPVGQAGALWRLTCRRRRRRRTCAQDTGTGGHA